MNVLGTERKAGSACFFLYNGGVLNRYESYGYRDLLEIQVQASQY